MKRGILGMLEKKDKRDRTNFLILQLPSIFLEIEQQAKIEGNSMLKVLKLLRVREIFMALVLLQNFFILFFMKSETKNQVILVGKYSVPNGELFIRVLTIIILSLCVARLFLYVLFNFNICFYGYWKRKLEQYAQLIDLSTLSKPQKQILAKHNENRLGKKDILDIISLYLTYSTGQRVYSFYLNFFFYFHGLYSFMINHKFLMLISYILFCVFGLYFDLFFYYSFLLLEFSMENPAMKTVYRAITLNKNQFMLLFLFLFCIVIIFANFAYHFISHTFWMSFGNWGRGEMSCTSIWQCVLTIFSLGLRSSVGDVIQRESYHPDNRGQYLFRWVYDSLAFIVINVIFMNIIFGIIIDTYKLLRSQSNQLLQEKSTLCYVCYLTRTEFDKEQKDFKEHIKNNHNLWNYIFFVYYLHNKLQTEYTGVEAEIRRKLNRKDINWIPFMASEDVRGENFSFKEQFAGLNRKIEEIRSFF